ncbi:MAG: hypothetical protein H7099_09715 [Gemmatimonadaceae bacterium]|nr:hypothetical protein [Gemmatimonadaceae bacterium]
MGRFSLFHLVFVAGLLMSVRVMVAGVERDRGEAGSVVRTRWAMLAGALTLTGFVGSLLVQQQASGVVITLASIAAVLMGVSSARFLVRRAVAIPVSDHEFDPRFAMQGVPALVVAAIPAFGAGQIRLPAHNGASAVVAARSVDGTHIGCDVEVGVERIDDGVAFVEVWSAIEARL